MRCFFALIAYQRPFECLLAVDTDNFNSGSRALRQIRRRARRAENRQRPGERDDRNDESVIHAEFATLVDNPGLELVKFTPLPNVAPSVRLHRFAHFRNQRVAFQKLFFLVVFDVILRPGIEDDAFIVRPPRPRH